MSEQEKQRKFTLNGEEVTAGPGETVLDVARRRGVPIPTLCYHESVAPYASCRLCIVEVSWNGRSKLVTSCVYQPYEGDNVETDSARVQRARRMVLEMLLSRCPQSEVIRRMAAEYGVQKTRFEPEEKPGPSDCILCGLCVRVCGEVVGQNALGYAQRGPERYVTTAFDEQADECIGCGACAAVCPTGAIHFEDADGVRIMKEFNTRIPLARCRICGEFFTTDKVVRKIQEELGIPLETVEICPRCRGKDFTGRLARVLSIQRNPARKYKGTAGPAGKHGHP